MGRCLEGRGKQLIQPLMPDSEDYFALKPLHSAFYMTPLEVLLPDLQVERLILTGLTSNSCITATAHDANMRGFNIYIPADCSCARNENEHAQALAQLRGYGRSKPHPFAIDKTAKSYPQTPLELLTLTFRLCL